MLKIPEDITGRLLNVFHDFTSSNYTFEEDFATQQEMLKNEEYFSINDVNGPEWERQSNDNQPDDLSHHQIYDLCTKTIVNSSVAIACGPYFDQDIMHAIEICYQGKWSNY